MKTSEKTDWLQWYCLLPAIALFILPYMVAHDALDRSIILRMLVNPVADYFSYVNELAAVSPYPHQVKVSLSIGIVIAPFWAAWIYYFFMSRGGKKLDQYYERFNGIQIIGCCIIPFFIGWAFWGWADSADVSHSRRVGRFAPLGPYVQTEAYLAWGSMFHGAAAMTTVWFFLQVYFGMFLTWLAHRIDNYTGIKK